MRGLYTPSARNVALLEQANLTSFVHESGHLFLDQTAEIAARQDAPADIQSDMQTLLDWFGIKAEEGAPYPAVRSTIDAAPRREMGDGVGAVVDAKGPGAKKSAGKGPAKRR